MSFDFSVEPKSFGYTPTKCKCKKIMEPFFVIQSQSGFETVYYRCKCGRVDRR